MGQDPRYILLVGSTKEVLCGSWAKTRLVNSDQRNQVLLSFLGALYRRHMRGRPWRERKKKCLSQVVRKVIAGTCIHLWLMGRAGVVQGPFRLYKLNAKAEILWSRPVTLSTRGTT